MRRQPTLRSQLNQIRMWVRQGRTDAWIAHKLDVTIDQLERFKRDHSLEGDETAPGRPADPLSVPPPELDVDVYDLEDEEDEPPEVLIEELEPEERPPGRERPRGRGRSRSRSRAGARERDEERDRDEESDRDYEPDRDEQPEREPAASPDGDQAPRRRRRGRRGGRRRRRPSTYEATFDHGEDGYGLWLDPAVIENPVYSQHWAGHRAVQVTFAADAITIRKAGADQPGDDAQDELDEDEDRA